MEEIICKKCGVINNYRTEMKSGQNVAWCNDCGAYIKCIPYAEPAIHFGKYKGKKISEMKSTEEKSYLKWILVECKLSKHIREAIERQINNNDWNIESLAKKNDVPF